MKENILMSQDQCSIKMFKDVIIERRQTKSNSDINNFHDIKRSDRWKSLPHKTQQFP